MNSYTYTATLEARSGKITVSGIFQATTTEKLPSDQLVSDLAKRHDIEDKRKITIDSMSLNNDH
jgi:hypothetical protein